jgi:signal transduction histidine kinase
MGTRHNNHEAASAWRALTGGPRRLLASAWPWRSTAYLLTGWAVAALTLTAMITLIVIPAVGLAALLAGIPLAAVERWRLRLVDPAPAPSPHTRLHRPGLWGWLSTRLQEPATWKELGYALLFCIGLAWLDAAVGLILFAVLFLIAFPALVSIFPDYQPDRIFGLVAADLPEAFIATALGLAILPIVLYLITAYAAGRATLTRTMLTRRDTGAADAEMVELSRSRARIMDSMDAQRRRIERDLHDGAQQRLTGLIMTLGLARLQRTADPEAADQLVDKAYDDAKTALSELRDLVHGIHPQILTDRGLEPAVAELADRCPIPVEIDIDLPQRPPEPVEAAAWFIIGEALTNITRHSQATRAWVNAGCRDRLVVIEVGDDGIGAADPARGSGLAGLSDRVAVLDGQITLTSPTGGPTVVRVELPCAL